MISVGPGLSGATGSRSRLAVRRTHLVESHKLLARVLRFLVERGKLDVLRRPSLVPEGGSDGVEIMRADGYELAVSAEVGMELVLQVKEALVGRLGKGLLEPKDGGGKVWPDRIDRCGNVDLE